MFLRSAIAAVVIVFAPTLVGRDATAELVLLGNPHKSAGRYSTNFHARGVHAMEFFKGGLYLGAGDSVKNSGNTPLVVYTPATSAFTIPYTVPEESITRFRDLDGVLYIPGGDRTGSGTSQLYRSADGSSWTALPLGPTAAHAYDVIRHDGKLFVAFGTTTTTNGNTVAISSDNGATWSYQQPSVPWGQLGTPSYPSPPFRSYRLLHIGGELHLSQRDVNSAFVAKSGVTRLAYAGPIYKWNGSAFIDPHFSLNTTLGFDANGFFSRSLTANLDTYFAPYATRPGRSGDAPVGIYTAVRVVDSLELDAHTLYLATYRETVFASGAVEMPEPPSYGLMVGKSVATLQHVNPFGETAEPIDLVARDGVAYSLTNTRNPDNTFTIGIWSSDPGSGHTTWTRLLHFNYASRAESFAFDGARFYIGIGALVVDYLDSAYSYIGDATKSGDLLRVSAFPTSTPGTLTAWRELHFTPAELAQPALEISRWGLTADPDADGRSNLLEYALNSHPTHSTPPIAPVVSLTSSIPHSLRLNFTRHRPDVRYEILASPDLAQWTVIATDPGQLGSPVEVVDSDTSPPSTQRFLRLRVTPR